MATKGITAEEALREYFVELGYFVVRGMSVKVGTNHVTDIDLWLYNRPSPVTRERLNVDIKNKKTPQALERIVWAKGLQVVLGYDGCIVATSERRPEVIEFGRRHAVTVLDGQVLRRLCSKDGSRNLHDEDFRDWSSKHRQARSQTGWYERSEENAAVLGQRLGFDGCNYLLPQIRYFAEQTQLGGVRQEEAVRHLYLNISYFLISLDYALADAAFLASEERQRKLEDGFRFGQAGKAGTERITETAIRLAYAATGANPAALRASVRKALQDLNVGILSEYFGKTAVCNGMFTVARELNHLAFRKDLIGPHDLTNGARGALFILLDFLGLERASFMASVPRQALEADSSSDSRISEAETQTGMQVVQEEFTMEADRFGAHVLGSSDTSAKDLDSDRAE